MDQHWQTLTMNDFPRLREARENLHQAAQLLAAAARNHFPAVSSDGFANLDWVDETQSLVSRLIGGRWLFRVALSLPDLSLNLETPMGEVFRSQALSGLRYAEAQAWLLEQLRDMGMDTDGFSWDLPYDIPQYSYATGTAFNLDAEASKEAANYYSNGYQFLKYSSSRYRLWLPFKCWPHHFDMASRRQLPVGGENSQMGIGFSPGDAHNFEMPYFHLTRYPHDTLNKENLSNLPEGLRWHTDRWFGMNLLAEDLVNIKDGTKQAALAKALIDTGCELLEAIR